MITPAIYIFFITYIYVANSQLYHIPLRTFLVSPPRVHSQIHREWVSKVQLDSSNFSNVNLGGNLLTVNYGKYATLYFDGQPVNLRVDTGSSNLAVPMKKCTNCRYDDNRFDLDSAWASSGWISCENPICRPNACSTPELCSSCSTSGACCSKYAHGSCSFSLNYAGGESADGALVRANVRMGNISTSLVFGGILKDSSGFEEPNIDGILGLAYKYGACSPSCVEPLMDRFVREGSLQRDVFSICTSTLGGTITLGGSDPNFYKDELRYVSMRRSEGLKTFYDIEIQGVHIGRKEVKVPNFNRTIVDSGSSVIIVKPESFQTFKTFFQKHYCHVPGLCSGSKRVRMNRIKVSGMSSAGTKGITEENTWFQPNTCVKLEKHEVLQLPDIKISLNGTVIILDPDTYMHKYEEKTFFGIVTYRCLGIQPLDILENTDLDVIFGEVLFLKYFVEFDRVNDRLGFALSRNCISERNPGLNTFKQEKPVRGLEARRSSLIFSIKVLCVVGLAVFILSCILEDRNGFAYTLLQDYGSGLHSYF